MRRALLAPQGTACQTTTGLFTPRPMNHSLHAYNEVYRFLISPSLPETFPSDCSKFSSILQASPLNPVMEKWWDNRDSYSSETFKQYTGAIIKCTQSHS